MTEEDFIDKSHWLPDKAPVILPERRGSVVATEGERGGKQFHSLTCPLEYYVAKRIITGKQYRAGKRLNMLWVKGTKSPWVQVQYRDGDGGARETSFIPLGMGAVDYREAIYTITDPHARFVVAAVCCEAIFAVHCIKGSRRTRERKSMILLRDALDTLARYFKYDDDEK